MRGFITVGLIFLCAVLNGCGGKPVIRQLSASSTVVAFGDSLTFGSGAEEDESYPYVLSQLIGCRVVNAGVPGEDSSAALRRLPGVLKKHHPNLVILCSGGNDMLQKQSKVKTKEKLDAMISLIKKSNADIILVGVPEPGLRLKVPDLYADLAREYAIPFDQTTLKEVLSSSSLKSDLVHPNAEGYRLMAEEIFSLIGRTIDD